MPTSSGPAEPSADPVPGRPDPRIPLLLLHVPRTGGSTLKFLLRAVYGTDRTLLDAHRYARDTMALDAFAVVEGHFAAPFLARRFGADWPANAVTLLREPITRTVSQARHIRARPGPLQDMLARPVRDADELFARLPRLGDLQTKLLAGSPLDEPADEAALAAAIAVLERMAFGPTTAIDATIALLSERFGFGAVNFGVSNAAAPTGDDDLRNAAFRAAAADHNRLDRRLWEHAERVFADRADRFAAALLALPLTEGTAAGGIRYLRAPVTGAIPRPAPGIRSRISGWILVDGHAPDAVLVRAGDSVAPVVPRVHRDEAARTTGNIADRRAGFTGMLSIPPEASTVEIIAFDRQRARRARVVLAVEEAPGPQTRQRLAARLRRRS